MKKKLLLLSVLCFLPLVGCNKESEQNKEDTPVVPDDPPLVEDCDIVKRAKAELGKPYQWGAIGPDSYDASGFVSYCVTGAHQRIGTNTTFMSWPLADPAELGDICVNQGNCGIYVGEEQMIYAGGYGDVVKYGPLEASMIIVRYPG